MKTAIEKINGRKFFMGDTCLATWENRVGQECALYPAFEEDTMELRMILQKTTSKDVQTEILPFALGLLIIGRSTPECNLEMTQQSEIFEGFWETIKALGFDPARLSDDTMDVLRTLVTHLATHQRKEVL